MKLHKRLSFIEKQFSLSEKNDNSELEMVLNINDTQEIEVSRSRLYSDGRREPISKFEADGMMECDNHCEVTFI